MTPAHCFYTITDAFADLPTTVRRDLNREIVRASRGPGR